MNPFRLSLQRAADARARWALIPILLIGAALRFYAIGALPPGLYRDEAFYGLDALGVLRGDLSLYFLANNGREGMFMYLLAASIAGLGGEVLALRIVSAMAGVLTLAAVYAMGRAMCSPRVGLLAAAVMSITFWHLALSRVAFRAILLPLWLALAAALLFAALRSPHRLHLALSAGAAIGLTAYTYTSAQMLPLLLAIWGATTWREWRSAAHQRALMLTLGAALVAVLPMLVWLALHGALYFNRASQVSILSPAINNGDPFGMLLRNALKVAGMFFVEGDRIWRHNLALRPAFDLLMGACFVLGVIAAVRQWRSSAGARFTLIGLGIFALPTLLAEDAPHFLRAIGMLPFTCLLAAYGLDAAMARFASLRHPLRSLSGALAIGVLAVSGGITTLDYFSAYVHQPSTAHWLEAHNVALARAARDALAGDARVHLDKRLTGDNPALRFLLPALEGAADFGTHLRVGDPHSSRVRLIADPNHDWRSLLSPETASPVHLSLQLGPTAQGDRDPQPRRAFIVLNITPAAAWRDPPVAVFDQRITLLRASLEPLADGQFAVRLLWEAREAIAEDFAVFVHWTRHGQLIAQADSSPAYGFLPMPAWRPGDQILDEHFVQPLGDAQPGDQVHIGIYRREDNARLPTQNGDTFITLEVADTRMSR